jgi:hypothetical protein
MAEIDPRVNDLDPVLGNHVKDLIKAASQRYHLAIRVNQGRREAKQAQTFHILHMYMHNYFPHRRPKKQALAEDGRTIKWSYLSDPNIPWALIDHLKGDFLKTAAGGPALLQDDGKGQKRWVVEPSQVTSTRVMAEFLKKHGVSGMAAPGLNECGEPCCCGGHPSSHVAGKACDLAGMDSLGQKIFQAEPGKHRSFDEAVDHFLAEFDLYRPMAHLPGKAREIWHVELLPPHHRKTGPRHPAAQTYPRVSPPVMV